MKSVSRGPRLTDEFGNNEYRCFTGEYCGDDDDSYLGCDSVGNCCVIEEMSQDDDGNPYCTCEDIGNEETEIDPPSCKDPDEITLFDTAFAFFTGGDIEECGPEEEEKECKEKKKFNEECEKENDCELPFVCMREGSNSVCKQCDPSDSDAINNFICSGSDCQPDGSCGECMDSDDCNEGKGVIYPGDPDYEYCMQEGDNRVCKDSIECDDDSDCVPGNFCRDKGFGPKVCSAVIYPCTFGNGDCPEGYGCYRPIVTAGGYPPSHCLPIDDKQCFEDYNECLDDYRKCNDEGKPSAECKIIRDGCIVDLKCSFKLCENHTECGAGEYCSGNTCQPIPPSCCDDDSPCPYGNNCIDSMCKPVDPIPRY